MKKNKHQIRVNTYRCAPGTPSIRVSCSCGKLDTRVHTGKEAAELITEHREPWYIKALLAWGRSYGY